MTTAYIALGSNVGNRVKNLGTAVAAIAALPDTRLLLVSHAYESEPAYRLGQAAFANGAVEIDTEMSAEHLLGQLQQIEDDMGRVRAEANGPRVIDLDILLFGDEEILCEELTVPHPLMLERDFVVTPLLEIAPRLHLPDGTRIERENATVGAVVDDLGPIPDGGVAAEAPEPKADWVVAAENTGEQDQIAAWDAGMHFKAEALAEAGIPFAWDPYEPESGMDPFGLPRTFRLMVPADQELQVAQLFADLAEAKPQFPDAE
jgi:2-amino-4-hydroxy-6-hydroxymethyldihydropteridine diphosphokinase